MYLVNSFISKVFNATFNFNFKYNFERNLENKKGLTRNYHPASSAFETLINSTVENILYGINRSLSNIKTRYDCIR